MRAPALALCVLLQACASGAVVTRGEGASIAQAQAQPAIGGKYRVAVGAIIDKTDPLKEQSLERQLQQVNAGRADVAQLQPYAVLHGIQDLLVTELFNVDSFVVLERAALDEVVTEQEFSRSARAGDATRIPKGGLEGAELIVVGALTAFDAGAGGGALPLPIPLGNRGDFGVLKLALARGYVAMDLRVIDARTARVLSSVAVTGRNTRFGLDFSAFLNNRHGSIRLPGVLTYFNNTPVEKALQEMVTAAVTHIVQRTPADVPHARAN
jgi:curli biogenesis system outer membrane secretion channel CsgG